MRLNGWQRLWVVACGFGVIAVAVGTMEYLPSDRQIMRQWAQATVDRVYEYFQERPNEAVGDGHIVLMEQYRITVGDRDNYEAYREGVQARYSSVDEGPRIDFGPINSRFSEQVWQLRIDQGKTVALWVGVWLIGCVVLYTAGSSVAWIRRGFRQQNPESK